MLVGAISAYMEVVVTTSSEDTRAMACHEYNTHHTTYNA
jgi:hypothetical protein